MAEPEAAQPETPLEIPEVPLLASGLPAISRGGTLRIGTLERGTQLVDGKQMPSALHPGPAVKAKLDEAIAGYHDYGRCELPLALETLVSLRCAHSQYDDMRQESELVHTVQHFAISPAGEVEKVALESLLHPGLSNYDMGHLLAHNPTDMDRALVFSDTGLEMSYDAIEEELDINRVPWRQIAPYVRGDGPLGPALLRAGLPLAPRGTSMSLPPKGPAIWNYSDRALMALWARAPVELRAQARFTTFASSGHTGLLFPPTVDAAQLRVLLEEFEGDGAAQANRLRFDNTHVGEGYYSDLIAPLVVVEAKEELKLRAKPGQKVEAEHTLAAGTLLVSIDGFIYRNDSEPGSQRWAFVLGPNDETGWVKGKKLALRDDVGRMRTMAPPEPEKVDLGELLDQN